MSEGSDPLIEAGTGRAAEIPSLTALRGIASVLVVLFHYGRTCFPASGLFGAAPFLAKGYLAVDFFFLLSGFVVAHAYGAALADGARGSVRRFLQARLARVYPLHLVTFVAVVGIWWAAPRMVYPESFPLGAVPLNLVMLQQMYQPPANWNFPSWSIGDEVLVYGGFAAGARVLMRGRAGWTIGLGMVAGVVGMAFLLRGDLDAPANLFGLGRAAAGFTVGVLTYRAWRERRGSVRRGARWGLVPLAGLAGVSGFDAWWYGAFAALIVVAAEATGLWRAALNRGVLRVLGDVSYSVYLWHAPLYYALAGVLLAWGVSPLGLRGWTAAGVEAGLLAVTLGVAWGSFWWIEVPARRALRPRVRGAMRGRVAPFGG